MLEYLVTSNTRRTLLKLLWLEGLNGTANELAQKAGVAFAGAYLELKAMVDADLAKVEWKSGKKHFSANFAHPGSRLLKKLLEQPVKSRDSATTEALQLKADLVSLGLPVFAGALSPASRSTGSLESLVVEAAKLAEDDASVARSLPVLLVRLKDQLDYKVLKQASRRADSKHRVGFFLDLAGKLGSDVDMSRAAESFFDHRRKLTRSFFSNQSKYSTELALKRTPDLAKKWGWTMNMGLDAFESTYRKFVDEPVSD